MESTTVTLGGRLVQLQPPPFDHRADIALTLAEAQGRGDNLAAYARIG